MFQKIRKMLFRSRYANYLNINDTVQQRTLDYRYRKDENSKAVHEYGYSVYSQHEEDGMLRYIFNLIGEQNKVCIEMCCGIAMESNTANLIVNHFWTGYLFDGDKKKVKTASQFYAMHKNTSVYPPKIFNSWINKNNINDLLSEAGLKGEVDLFSLDTDGVDYYLFEALEVVSPRVVILEVNHILGFEKSVGVPYIDDFVAEFSADGTDYAGASLMAFVKLAKRKGYRLIGLNRFCTNAIFLRNDITHTRLPELTDFSEHLKHPRVQYGLTERYKRVAHKKWVELQ